MAISPGRYRDELYPILARNAAENPQRTADCSAMGQYGYGFPMRIFPLFAEKAKCEAPPVDEQVMRGMP
jgi:hypothetical protein